MPAKKIRLYGIVQGVGFRPFVARSATTHKIVGTVANKGSYVEVQCEGSDENLRNFIHVLKTNPPKRACILEVDIKDCERQDFTSFEIIESEKETGDIFVSPDIATCEDCTRELFDKSNRRYHHPFINCTQCGPRVTILDSMPYDRERTSMGEFPMCQQCHNEYTVADTRRYDAQPVCCNDCGPEVYIIGSDIKKHQAITLARKSIMEGKIIAIKGIGGFHLCCDALNENAVGRLRKLKNRPSKPFAVMMKNLDVVKRECVIKQGQEEYITGYQKPIMLLEKKSAATLCENIAPDNFTVGVMLPYAPVQMLIFDYDDDIIMTDCLVMTSANVSGAPICRNDEDAVNEILSFCDLILSHNRKIRLRADDSVVDWLDGKPYMIRRSRGFAPLPIILSANLKGCAVGIGGELKNTFCIGKNNLLYLSPYVGDMADIRTAKALEESLKRMEDLLEAEPTSICCDMHPKYNTVTVAEETGLPVLKIQHHYAHILSCMAENDYFEKCIGVSFDGTGYGEDSTVWGGEFLICDFKGFHRIGHIKPFLQAGGDKSAKEGFRIAVQMLIEIYGNKAWEIIFQLDLCDEKTFNMQSFMARQNINCVKSTSCGRLFDGVSAILGIKKTSTFEGEASITLQYFAEKFIKKNGYVQVDLSDKILSAGDYILSTDLLVKDICQRVLNGDSAEFLAYYFHIALAKMVVENCIKIRESTSLNTVALSGGVFQNRVLTKTAKKLLEENDFKVLIHSLCPANDGGIALGQAAYALFNNNGGI